MSDRNAKDGNRRHFRTQVEKKEALKLKARERQPASALYGLGVIGIIGWSVVVPTMIGVAVGLYIDERWPGRISWTLTLMFVGLALGSLNAWHWISSQRRKIEEEQARARVKAEARVQAAAEAEKAKEEEERKGGKNHPEQREG